MTGHPHIAPEPSYLIRILALGGILWLAALLTVSDAQITLDGSLGPRGSLTGPNYRIDANMGQIRGGNLFHSFGEFNVPTRGSATFTGPNGIANILSRVTGGQPSAIDGLLRSEIPGANLFLLNPSGVLFGQNARLEVNGSFHMSTADFLRFADGSKFFTTLGQESVLTVAPPAAFGFVSPTPAAIAIQGSTLRVLEGKALSVVGGDVQIVGGRLVSPSGRIQLASAASPGEAPFSPLELAPDLQVDAFAHLGRLELSQGALLNASGVGVPGSGGPGGTVLVRGGRLLVDRSSILANTLGDVNGARLGLDLRIAADAIMTNDSELRASPRGAGDGGDIVVNVGGLTLTDGSGIFSSSFGAGRSGDLTVTASDAIAIAGRDREGNPSGLFSNAFSLGDGGRLFVSAPTLTIDAGEIEASTTEGSRGHAGGAEVWAGRLTLTGGARIDTSTSGSGRGGALRVAATDFSMDGGRITSGTSGGGDAGNLDVRVGRLTLTGGAQLSTSTTGSGRGGELTVSATDAIAIAGRDRGGFRSGLFSTTDGSGDGGRLFVSAPMLSMDGGRIAANTLGGGNAGNVDVRVGKLMLLDGAQISSATGIFRGVIDGVPIFEGIDGPGRGGDLTVIVTDAISIAGRDSEGFRSALGSNAQFGRGRGGNLFVSTPSLTMDDGLILASTERASSGDAGNLLLEVGRLTMSGGAQINTSTTGSGRGGALRVLTTEAISLTGRGSVAPQTGLFSVADGSGDAGRLFVSAPLLESVGGRILGRTLGGGHAGDIELRVGRLALTEGAQIFNGTGIGVRDGVIGQEDGLGRGGNLTVVATDSIFIAGSDQQGFLSGLFSGAQIGRGDAGNLFISTPTLTMMDSGLIAAETFSTSSGNAGNIEVRVGRLALSEGAQISTSSVGMGRGGNVSVAAAEQIELSKGGTISASSSGQGDAGNIVIQAGERFRSRNGAVTTEAARAGGGTIALTAGRLVQLQDSEVTTSVRGGGADAGNLTLDSPFVVADGSQIIANAFGGRGGNILINAGVFLADPASLLDASSELGIAGTVDIRAPVTSLGGTLAPLPQAFVSAAALLPARCAARAHGGRYSSLVLGGRDGLPADPGGLVPSPRVPAERLAADPALTGEPHRQKSAATFALLAAHEQALPQLGCPQ